MQIVKTANHLIYSAEKAAPSHACLGVCKKVWWTSDMAGRTEAVAKPSCPQCGGTITTVIPEGHYSLISNDAGAMKKNGATITNAGLNLGGKQ
jgi:hypothetical protein